VTVVLFFVADGLASVPWFELFSKVIPPTRRGRVTGTGQALSGVLSFMAGAAVEWVLSARGPSFPLNYVTLWLCGFGMMILSLLALWLAVEERSETAPKNPTWREYLPKLWAVLKSDRNFRRYTIARQLAGLSGLASPFYMTYALTKLNLPIQVAGRYTSIGVIGSIVAAVGVGWVNERYGSKRAIHVSIGMVTIVPLLALAIPHVITNPTWLAWGYGLVFFCHYASMSTMMPSWVTYVLELAPEGERPTYVGLANTLNGLTTIFSTIGGLILVWTNSNYSVLFVVTFVGLLLAWPLPFGLPEPRHRQIQNH
jgi:MFS family permease